MGKATVLEFSDEQWPIYRDLRLQALKDSPDAFGTTLQQALLLSDEDWQQRLLQRQPHSHLALWAQYRGEPVALAWCIAQQTVAHILQMWVAPQARGVGISRQLMQQLIAWAQQQTAIQTLQLGVTQGNAVATKLYQSFGFSNVGNTEALRPGSDLQVQNMQLPV